MDLDAIEQRTRAATEGPWDAEKTADCIRITRDHVPALVARVKELEEENQRLRKTAHDAFRLGLRLEDQPGTIYHRSFWEEPEDHLRYMSTYTGGNASTRKEQQ